MTTRMTTSEKDVERALRLMVERHGGVCLKWVCPSFAGVPDRIVLMPGGRIIFVEVKRPKGGKVGKLQEWWAERLTALGFEHYFIWNKEDVERLEKAL